MTIKTIEYILATDNNESYPIDKYQVKAIEKCVYDCDGGVDEYTKVGEMTLSEDTRNSIRNSIEIIPVIDNIERNLRGEIYLVNMVGAGNSRNRSLNGVYRNVIFADEKFCPVGSGNFGFTLGDTTKEQTAFLPIFKTEVEKIGNIDIPGYRLDSKDIKTRNSGIMYGPFIGFMTECMVRHNNMWNRDPEYRKLAEKNN